MQICLEGPSRNWDWFDFSLGKENLGLDLDKVKKVCGTDDPVVIDIDWGDSEELEGLLVFDGMGYTPVSNLFKQAKELSVYDEQDLKSIAAYLRVKGGTVEDALDDFENHAYWTISDGDPDPEAFARELVSEGGYDADFIARHFDYAALGRDLLLSGDYETDETDEYAVGEEYIDGVYGGIEHYIEDVGMDYAIGYFDYESYGRDLAISWSYDNVSSTWVSESSQFNKNSHKLHIKEDITITISNSDDDDEPLILSIPDGEASVCPMCGLDDCTCDMCDCDEDEFEDNDISDESPEESVIVIDDDDFDDDMSVPEESRYLTFDDLGIFTDSELRDMLGDQYETVPYDDMDFEDIPVIVCDEEDDDISDYNVRALGYADDIAD